MILHQLSRPFAFNKIVSTELNSVRYYVPGIITAVASGVYFILPKPPEILGDKRYLDYLLQIVGILPGFYIAALAAGATFANPSLDEPMPGKTPPTLKMRRMGQMHDEPLTTRLFICHLFAYLSAVSLMLAFAILVAIEINPSIEDILNRKANLDGGSCLSAHFAMLIHNTDNILCVKANNDHTSRPLFLGREDAFRQRLKKLTLELDFAFAGKIDEVCECQCCRAARGRGAGT